MKKAMGVTLAVGEEVMLSALKSERLPWGLLCMTWLVAGFLIGVQVGR